MPLRHLPVIQNWDCHSCTNCCREYNVPVSAEERRRIEAQGWEADPDFAGLPLFVRYGPWWARRYRLRHRAEGPCIFLGPDNRCRIHARFGADAKPLACRLFPFVLVPAGEQWRVGVRFACPSAAANRGRPLPEHAAELDRYTRLVEGYEGARGESVPPPPLQRGQRVAWRDVLRLTHTVLSLLRDGEDRLERRWRKCLALAGLCRQARFDRLAGGRLKEFLDVVRSGLDAEVPRHPADVAAPTWVGRTLFRQEAAVYARKDRGADRGAATRSWLSRFRAGWRFARGRGPVPAVNALLAPGVTFARMEEPAGELPADAEAVLERYSLVKVESLQFCGPTHFGLPFWDGLESLALTVPLILWLSRGIAAASRAEAVTQAAGIVDDHFGYNRALRMRRHRVAARLLAQRGELARLIAWYSR
jgi:lysine-N-methylase